MHSYWNLSYFLELVPVFFKIFSLWSLIVYFVIIDCFRNMVSNGEVIHSGAIDGSNINAQVSPSDLQVALRYMFHLIVFKDPIS